MKVATFIKIDVILEKNCKGMGQVVVNMLVKQWIMILTSG